MMALVTVKGRHAVAGGWRWTETGPDGEGVADTRRQTMAMATAVGSSQRTGLTTAQENHHE